MGPDRTGRWRAMAIGLVATFMTLLDVSIVNVAVPSIQSGLRLGTDALQWVLSGYALTFGLLLVPAGRFGDARGRRGAFVAGLAVFTGASAAAGVATGAGWLIGARLLQGAAAGVVNPQVTGMVQQLFVPSERGRPFGMIGSTVGISTAVGPLLGGALIQTAGTAQGWRWVFYINIPVGIVAVLLGWRWIPSTTVGQGRGESLDPVGVLLLGAGVVVLMLPLVQERQWHGPAKWGLMPLAAALLAGFVRWERRYARTRRPLVDLALFRRRSYALGAVIATLYFAGFTAIFFVFALFLQRGLGDNALVSGAAIMPFALGSATAAAVGGRLVNRYGRPLVAAGLAIVAVGLGGAIIALDAAPGGNAPLATAVPLLVAGVGSGLVITPNQTLTLAEVPVAQAGSAGGVLQTGQRIGTAIGIAGVGAVFFSTLASSSGHWAQAFRTALLTAVGFVVAAGVAAVVDIVAGSRSSAAGEP